MNAAGLDATFAALSDPTRRATLSRLSRGEATVTGLAAPFDISLPAISKTSSRIGARRPDPQGKDEAASIA